MTQKMDVPRWWPGGSWCEGRSLCSVLNINAQSAGPERRPGQNEGRTGLDEVEGELSAVSVGQIDRVHVKRFVFGQAGA